MKKRPHYATRAEYEADTTWYWERDQIFTVIATFFIAAAIPVVIILFGR